MFKPVQLNDLLLHLARYPADNCDHSLQAWDAADEYLYQQLVSDTNSTLSRVLVFNDNFGAIANFLLAQSTCNELLIDWQSDSHVARLACQQNLAHNHLNAQSVQFYSSLEFPEQQPDLIVMRLPRNLGYFEWQLATLATRYPGTPLLIGAKMTECIPSVHQLIDKYASNQQRSLAKKKARLLFAEFAPQAPKAAQLRLAQSDQDWLAVPEFQLQLRALPNVFANRQLDIGARALLPHVPKDLAGKVVVDLGCGNGILGLRALQLNPNAKLQFVDESYQAIAAVQAALTQQFSAANTNTIVSDCLSDFAADSVDMVICNPPFHQGNTVTDHIALQMLNDAKRVLKTGGQLLLVGNRHLNYHIQIKQLFGNCSNLSRDTKFVVLTATK